MGHAKPAPFFLCKYPSTAPGPSVEFEGRGNKLGPGGAQEPPHGLRPTSLKMLHRSFFRALGPLSEPAGESKSFPATIFMNGSYLFLFGFQTNDTLLYSFQCLGAKGIGKRA